MVDGMDEYQVNGRSALEWLINRYQITTDTASGIHNDPNAWVRNTTTLATSWTLWLGSCVCRWRE